jgi:hypothetical protein
MKPNEETTIFCGDCGSNKKLANDLTVNNNTTNQNNFQFNLFTTEQPKKILRVIHCCDCNHARPLDGYRFGLMPLCSDCRTEREVEITNNRFERRAKR